MRRVLSAVFDVAIGLLIFTYGSGIGLRFAHVVEWPWSRVLLWPVVLGAIVFLAVGSFVFLRDGIRVLRGVR